MKINWILLSLFFVLGIVHAAESVNSKLETEKFQIQGKWVSMIRDQSHHFLVSASCFPDQKCEAILKAKITSLKELAPKFTGGAHPGAVVCHSLGGKSVMAVDQNSNETTFCQFADQSMISNSTLFYHARGN
jgi:hypothetical protein